MSGKISQRSAFLPQESLNHVIYFLEYGRVRIDPSPPLWTFHSSSLFSRLKGYNYVIEEAQMAQINSGRYIIHLDLAEDPAPSRLSKMKIGNPYARWNQFSY